MEGSSLSPPRLNMFTMGNMGVMICLSQGGLRSLSASSYKCNDPTILSVIVLTSRITHWNQNYESKYQDVSLAIFLYYCPVCTSCTIHVIQMGLATGAIWVISTFNLHLEMEWMDL